MKSCHAAFLLATLHSSIKGKAETRFNKPVFIVVSLGRRSRLPPAFAGWDDGVAHLFRNMHPQKLREEFSFEIAAVPRQDLSSLPGIGPEAKAS